MFDLKTENFEAFATVPNAFAPHEISMIRANIEKMTHQPATVGHEVGERTDKMIRDSYISWLNPAPDTQWIFERLANVVNTVNGQYFGMELRTIQPIQLTEYDSEYQGFYGSHTDSSYGNSGMSRYRKLSVTMQLSDPSEYEGGNLNLYHSSLSPMIAAKERGTMTLFRSHILHEVTPVTKGKRYSFVTWVTGPLFK